MQQDNADFAIARRVMTDPRFFGPPAQSDMAGVAARGKFPANLRVRVFQRLRRGTARAGW
jgi:hypothetical protein